LRSTEPYGVIGPHADPVRDGSVLPHLLRELLLDPESFVGRLKKKTARFRMENGSD